MGWNYLSIPKLQRLHRWSLGMDKLFHPTHYNGCNYLSMLGLKSNHVSKRGHRKIGLILKQIPGLHILRNSNSIHTISCVCPWGPNGWVSRATSKTYWHSIACPHLSMVQGLGFVWFCCWIFVNSSIIHIRDSLQQCYAGVEQLLPMCRTIITYYN